MNQFEFVKSAGEPGERFLRGKGELPDAIHRRIDMLDLKISGLRVQVDGERVILHGTAASHADFEKAVLAAGNIQGVATVSADIAVAELQVVTDDNAGELRDHAAEGANRTETLLQQAESGQSPADLQAMNPMPRFYQVRQGDTLESIARQFYGDDNASNRIFEANAPLIESPDEIYPDQTLRLPHGEKEAA